MGVNKYVVKGRVYWRVDEWLTRSDGQLVRYRQKKIPTREQAMALAAKAKAEAFEGRFFLRKKPNTVTVAEAWEAYREVCMRDHRGGLTERSRGNHVVRHLGKARAEALTLREVDAFRTARLKEKTVRGGPPAPATLDFEVEILKRMLNYAVAAKMLDSNPLAGTKLLRQPNIRMRVIGEEDFKRLNDACEPALKPIVLMAFDTGMRKREVLDLRWNQVDMKAGSIRLAPQDTKGGEHRIIPLTARLKAALVSLPRRLGCEYVFPAENGRPWRNLDRIFLRAIESAHLEGLWFHDLRRSFITNARKKGVPESVVMRLSGHRTREVFDRYNIVSEDDLWKAVDVIQRNHGHVLDTFGVEAK